VSLVWFFDFCGFFKFFFFVGEKSRVLFLGRSMLSLLPNRGFFGGEERLWFLVLIFCGYFLHTYNSDESLLLLLLAPFFSFTSLYGFRPGYS
jgi:hypothetical protein